MGVGMHGGPSSAVGSAERPRAVIVTRDPAAFDLLLEEIESVAGDDWEELLLDDAATNIAEKADSLELVVLCVNRDDEADLTPFASVVTTGQAHGLPVFIVADEVSPRALHHLLKLGADDFLPYPLPEGELAEAMARYKARLAEAATLADTAAMPSGENREGALIAVHPLAGGSGASTFAVNLAWELQTLGKDIDFKVLIMDLNLQTGSVGTYLDVERRQAVFDLLSDISLLDEEAFSNVVQRFENTLDVFTSPIEILPLEFLSASDLEALLAMARRLYDVVIVDLPAAMVCWTANVLEGADIYFGTLELDLRSAQNAYRFINLLKAEELPVEGIRYVLNRAPKRTDFSGRAKAKRLAESIGVQIELHLPDGGKQVTEANDAGTPLALAAPKNPLRKEIARVASEIFNLANPKEEAA